MNNKDLLEWNHRKKGEPIDMEKVQEIVDRLDQLESKDDYPKFVPHDRAFGVAISLDDVDLHMLRFSLRSVMESGEYDDVLFHRAAKMYIELLELSGKFREEYTKHLEGYEKRHNQSEE